jgi:hypothetical protein
MPLELDSPISISRTASQFACTTTGYNLPTKEETSRLQHTTPTDLLRNDTDSLSCSSKQRFNGATVIPVLIVLVGLVAGLISRIIKTILARAFTLSCQVHLLGLVMVSS